MHGCGHTPFRPKDHMISPHTNAYFCSLGSSAQDKYFSTFYLSHCADTAIGVVHGIASCSGRGYDSRAGVVVVVVVAYPRPGPMP